VEKHVLDLLADGYLLGMAIDLDLDDFKALVGVFKINAYADLDPCRVAANYRVGVGPVGADVEFVRPVGVVIPESADNCLAGRIFQSGLARPAAVNGEIHLAASDLYPIGAGGDQVVADIL